MQPSFSATGYYDRPGHRYYQPLGNGHAFGELELGSSYVRFHEAAEIDAVIAELVALRAEMTGEPETEKVPWPTGLCGHTVTPGAWSHGFTRCRDCLSDTTPDSVSWYDRATAGEQLPQAAS